MKSRTFSEDLRFLQGHVETIVLGEKDGPQIAVVPAYQGRTMTSTTGDVRSHAADRANTGNTSFGWINYSLIESGKRVPQVNLYGGEDRFWLSPEGSQYSIFFDPGAEMNFANWRTPQAIDTDPFEVVEQTDNSVSFTHQASIRNYQDFVFEIGFERQVNLLDGVVATKQLHPSLENLDLGDLAIVAHESKNTLINRGDRTWQAETGLIAIWVLCMNKPSPDSTIVVPFKRGSETELGPIVESNYFGELDERRLKVDHENSLIYFLGDGHYRSKIGLSFSRAEPVLGAWDPSKQTLTVVQFNLPQEKEAGYTNNLWKTVDTPYDGDVINSYNDGPNESGGMLGPFYELETLSPAMALEPGASGLHQHRTIHVQGDQERISVIAERLFGVPLNEIEQQFVK